MSRNVPAVGKAHPEDVLLIGQEWERMAWPEFQPEQIVEVSEHASLRERNPRIIWVTAYGWEGLWRTPKARTDFNLATRDCFRAVRDASLFVAHTPPPRSLGSRILGWLEDRFIFTGGRA